MSTRLTNGGVPMVESKSLKLLQEAQLVNELVALYLTQALVKKGYSHVSPAALQFLGALDCGVNYGSEIARNLNVSRQMVAKHVKEYCALGYLQQHSGSGKQKQIVFTAVGEQLISDARRVLAELDTRLSASVMDAALSNLTEIRLLLQSDAKND